MRYAGDPAASPAMSAMPPKAEVNSEHSRLCSELSRFDGIARQIMGSGSAAHHHNASKTRVNALMVAHRVRGTQVDSTTAIPLAAACRVVARAQAASARWAVPGAVQRAHLERRRPAVFIADRRKARSNAQSAIYTAASASICRPPRLAPSSRRPLELEETV